MCNMEIGGKRLTLTITKMDFKILDKEMELERNFETSRTAEGGTRAGPGEKDYLGLEIKHQKFKSVYLII